MKKLILPSLLMLLYISSCTKLIQDDFPETDKSLVINSIIIAGQPISVNLSLNTKINAQEFTSIENARILLYENEVLIDSLKYTSQGNYVTDYLAQASKTYAIEVKTEQQNVYKEQFIPRAAEFINITHLEEASLDEEGVLKPALLFEISNQSGQPSYFYILIWMIRYGEKEKVTLIENTDILLMNEGTELALFTNELVKGDTLHLRVNYDTGSAMGSGGSFTTSLFPLIIELRTANQPYFSYIKQDYFYQLSRYPEVGTGNNVVVNPYDSFEEEEVTGIFAGYSTIVTDTIFPTNYQDWK